MNRSGLTLLEIMVALVILGLVVVGFLELFAATARSTHDLELWSRAVAHAENTIELVKLDPNATFNLSGTVAGGFERRVEVRAWGTGLQVATVVVRLPDGREFVLNRLLESP